MKPASPESPEQRLRHPDAHPRASGWRGAIGPGSKPFETLRRILVGVVSDGFIHAGNLAYLTLLTLFPFFIVITAIAQLFGSSGENLAAIAALIRTLPPSVATMVESTAREALQARTGPLLWLGAGVGLWSVTSYIETLRDILRRAYGTSDSRPFWHYRLAGIVVTLVSMSLLMFAFSIQIFFTAFDELIAHLPQRLAANFNIAFNRAWLSVMVFAAVFTIFWVLTPSQYRKRIYPKWPGALFTTLWWYGALTLLPRAIALFGGYTLTYGSLAGVVVALLFFWLVGYGLVVGAHINAALANPEADALRGGQHSILDELAEARWLDT